MASSNDPFNLNRFVEAQKDDYTTALNEIQAGQKRSHWIWYIFPQFDGLSFSSTSKHYAIKSLAEAQAYLKHPLLGPRLTECAEATLRLEDKSARQIFGSPDDLKLRSCATLFAHVSHAGSVFHQLLDKYFESQPDARTLEIIAHSMLGKNQYD